MKSQHAWYATLTPQGIISSGPAAFLFIFFVAYFIYLFFRTPINAMIDMCGCKRAGLEDIEVDEDIDLYQNCLDKDDQSFSLKEEENMRKFGMWTQLNETMKRVKGGELSKPEMHLQGIHTYDILRNPAYHQDFQYFAADLDDRASFIIDDNDCEDDDTAQSDLVRMVLNLAFIRKDELVENNFKFSAESCMDMKKKNVDSLEKHKEYFPDE